ncbi:protein CHUP1, chloroplastic-like isoform X2 [Durio zibethinus]|uniref:Protein CHUP1, chloroplastic-like isoform X2 n=1 Tax=Durio zibethinus TaxID=66656 RepID=A0A6P5X964_DURZI|nr:protein CHUP1, chloroplastic-like isoform X2 [Durio zibethinus]
MFVVMMLKEKRDLRPLLVKFGVAVALSFAGFLFSRLRTRKTKPSLPPPPPPSLHVSDCRSEFGSGGNDQSEDDFQALKISPTSDPEVERPKSDLDTSRTFISAEKDDYEQEIKHLRNMVRVLREREKNLEVQLLEYYGRKEQETTVFELQNRLKINNMEVKLFTLKIESLQSENQRLEGQVADHAKVVAELESARSRIKLLKKKLKHEAEQNREQILNLQKRVSRLQEQELKAPANNQDIESNLQRLKVLEGEAEELRKSNRRLEIENSELARKLDLSQILANSLLEDPEREAFNEMSNRLKQENEDLTKQNEQLQADRCADVEEMVYLRWINACLRYELRNYQPPTGKTVARDLSKSLSPKSEEKAKKLILEYAHTEGMGDTGMDTTDFDCDKWSSSQASYGTDTGELDDSSFENSSATKTTNSGKMKFFKNLSILMQGKDGHHQSQASSTSKTDHPEEVHSPIWSSGRGNASVTMLQSHSDRVKIPSQISSRTSLDVPRWKSLNSDHIKDVEKFRRNSDCSSYGYKRFMLGKDDACDSPLGPQREQDSSCFPKSDLVKFAEVLKEPGTPRAKFHRKAASII